MGRPDEVEQSAGSWRALLLQVAASLAGSLGSTPNAMAVGWGVVANWQLKSTADVDDGELRMSDSQRAWLNAMLYFGTSVGCLLGGRACARFGPRGTMLHALLPTALGNLILYLSSSFAMMMAGRLAIGISSGLPWAVYVLYISGTSSPRYRGQLSLMPDIACLGAIIATIALGDVIGWRWLAAVCGVFSLVPGGILLALLPDDPVWLLSRGRLAEAKSSAAKFGVELDLADSSALDNDESDGIIDTLRLLTRRKNLVPLGIVLMLTLFSVFSGYMTILTYSLEFFRQAGLHMDASVCSMLFCGIRVLSVMLTSQLVDRAGRRTMLMLSCSGVSLCYLGLVLFYQVPALQRLSALPIVLLLAAAFIYSAALACIPFCLMGEMFPLRMRQLGGSLVTCSYCIFNMVSTLVFPVTLAALGASGLFLSYAVIMAAAFVFTLLLVPETKGLSLAAIETLFDGAAPPPPPPASDLKPAYDSGV